MFLRSGSLNLKGIFETCSLLGVVLGLGAGSRAACPLLLMSASEEGMATAAADVGDVTTEVTVSPLLLATAAAASFTFSKSSETSDESWSITTVGV